MLNFYSEFKKYAKLDLGADEMMFRDWEMLQSNMYNNTQVSGSLTPYILEEREMRVTQMDIFSRLMMDRILWVAGPVNDQMSTVVQAQLMFLDNIEERDITMHVDSPGGSVKSGLSMVDVMNYVKSDIVTINTGMAASMGAVLLCAGADGKRTGLKHSRVMIHQPLGGAQGQAVEIEIQAKEILFLKSTLNKLIAEHTGQPLNKIAEDTDRDYFLSPQEAFEYGLIDKVVNSL